MKVVAHICISVSPRVVSDLDIGGVIHLEVWKQLQGLRTRIKEAFGLLATEPVVTQN